MLVLALLGCMPADVDLEFDDDADGLVGEAEWGTDPANPDSDGDGSLDGAEVAQGFDPMDPSEHPYKGGWVVGKECRDDVEPTGDAEGDVLNDFTLPDQFGDQWRLHDFCNQELYVYATMFG